MTPTQYAEALTRLGISNRAFCLTIIRVNDRTGRAWKSGDTPIPGSVAVLLRLALWLDLRPVDLIRHR